MGTGIRERIKTWEYKMSAFACTKCGKKYDAGIKFCSECGGEVTEKQQPSVPVFACSQCGKEYDAGIKFCNECGGKVTEKQQPSVLVFVCGQCGKEYDAGTKFCNECGGKVVEQKKSSSSSACAKTASPAAKKMTALEWVHDFFGESVQKLSNPGVLREEFFFAGKYTEKFVITPAKVNKRLREWSADPVDVDSLIYFYERPAVLKDEVCGGYFSTEGIAWFTCSSSSFNLKRCFLGGVKEIAHFVPWNEIRDIKIVGDPGSVKIARRTIEGTNDRLTFKDAAKGFTTRMPYIVINDTHTVVIGRIYPLVAELYNFFSAIANCQCSIYTEDELKTAK